MQSLSDFLPPLQDLTVNGEMVEAIVAFTYLSASISSTCHSHPEIIRILKMARASMKGLDHIWRSLLVPKTRVCLYNIGIIPIVIYASETWAPAQADNNKVDAFD